MKVLLWVEITHKICNMEHFLRPERFDGNPVLRKENIRDTFAYIDNVTVCGKNQEEHDRNLAHFLDCARKYNLTFNEDKSCLGAKEIKLLGFLASKGNIQPDPERLQPLKELAYPCNNESQKRVVGMFSYYSAWISHFSDKIMPLCTNKTFPLPSAVKEALEILKEEIAKALVVSIDPTQTLVVETDASDVAVSATLNQCGKPVAFFSRTLNHSERNHSLLKRRPVLSLKLFGSGDTISAANILS